MLPAEPFMVRHTRLLRSGTVLDLACGDGRNAIHLAESGFLVTAVDISNVALERLRHFSALRKVDLITREVDLDDVTSVLAIGTFDNIVVNHFRPCEFLWKSLPQMLKPGGRFIICAFNMKQHQHDGTPEQLCLEVAAYKTLHPGLELLHYESFTEADRFLDGYVFEKVNCQEEVLNEET